MPKDQIDRYQFSFGGTDLVALGSGALWWPEQEVLCFSDLHLGKSERLARQRGLTFPPYETRDTLDRLSEEINRIQPQSVVCLGDSFDDMEVAENLTDETRIEITRLQAGRRWFWIEGNHDPGPVELGGAHLAELSCGPLVFRHIATKGACSEVSGHYHPKIRIRLQDRAVSRPAFLVARHKLVMPAFGTYTGGLYHDAEPLVSLINKPAFALTTGSAVHALPLT